MAKTRFVQTSFNSGVLSPLIKGRTDIEQYYKGLETGENVVLIPQGGLKNRGGTDHIGIAAFKTARITTTPTMPNGGTAANINDDDDTTSTSTTTNISTIDPYVIAHYDLGSAKTIEFADVRGIFFASTPADVNDLVVQYSSDDAVWVSGHTFRDLGTSGLDMRGYIGETYRYWRLIIEDHTDLGANTVTLEEFNLFEETANNSSVKLKDFSVSVDKNYLMAFTEGNCSIYRKETDARVSDIKMPYIESQLADIRDTQSESVMLMFHEDVIPKRLVNLGTDFDWFLDDAPFINIPQYDFDDDLSPTPTSEVQVLTFSAGWNVGDTFQLDIEGVLSKNITFVGDTTADERSATAFNIEKNIQDMPVVGETGVSVARTGALAYTVTISGESTKDFELFSGFPTAGTASKTLSFAKTTSGVPRKEDVWSATRGYPKSACFYNGRLVLGGTKSKPQSLFLSKAGSAFDMDIDEGDDDDAIFTTISSRKLTNIVDVFPGRNLQIFTSGSEFTVNVTPVTPSTAGITPQTSHGALNIEVKEIDGATLFIDRNGGTLKRYLYNFNEDAYTTDDISVLSPELINSPVDMGILAGTQSDDANWVFIVNTDGSMTVLNTLRSQDINGFTKWTTGGHITDISVVDDTLYMANRRIINSVEQYHIEKWNPSRKTDNVEIIGGSTEANIGFDYLEGETVNLIADGVVLPTRTVSSGTVTLTADEVAQGYSSIEVGLYEITKFKTMPVNTNVGSGQNQMRRKKLVRMNMRVVSSHGLQVEGEYIPARSFGTNTLDTAPTQYTGIIDDIYNLSGWGREEMPEITCPEPTPMTVLAIEYEVESS